MSFESYFRATAGIGDAYSKGLDEFTQRTALAKLGTQLQGGDYNGAAQTAFAAGDAGAGINLLKLGAERSRDARQQANAEALFGGGGLAGLGSPGGAADSGLAPLGAPARALPSFADRSGDSGGYLASLETRESGSNPNARNPTSTATGLHQFTEKTWAGVMREHPELGLTPNGRTDPAQSRRAVTAFTADNERVLQRAGLPVNDATRYASHFLGRSGGPRFVAGFLRDPNAPASAYADAAQVRANRTVFFNRDGSPKSAGQVMADFDRSFSGGGRRQVASAPQPPSPSVPQRASVAFAGNEAETQALEAEMGMLPQSPRQLASADPRADLPAEGAVPMGYSIPEGQGAVGEEQPAGARSAVSTASPIFNGDAARLSNPVPGAGGRSMMLPPEAGGPPVQVAQAGGAPVGLPAASAGQVVPGAGGGDLMSRLAGMSPNARVSYLLRVSASDLPESARGPVKQLLENALRESQIPDGVKEYLWARSNGMTQARSPAEYAREQKGPQTVAPGTSVLAPDGQSVAFTVPDRNRSNVADDVDARRQAALANGLRPGTPQFDSYTLTGKMPREDQQPLSASDKKAILEADDAVVTAETAIGNLRAAKELSAKAYAGPLASERGQAMALLGNEAGRATLEFDNLVKANALGQLRAIFGAAPTEGERKILLEIEGSSSLPHAVRVKILDRGIALAERRLSVNRERASEMRGQTYFRPDGGPQGSRSSSGGARALPAPSPSNRPGAASASDRFGSLVGSGMSREQAFEQMQQEGY